MLGLSEEESYTTTVNAIGTWLYGIRTLTDSELEKWKSQFAQIPENDTNFLIATKAYCIFLIPIIPLETSVFFFTSTALPSPKIRHVFYPAGKGRPYFDHVKASWSFYIFPAILVVTLILNTIFRFF